MRPFLFSFRWRLRGSPLLPDLSRIVYCLLIEVQFTLICIKEYEMNRTSIIIALLFLAVIVGALEFRSANTRSGVENAINSVAPLVPAASLPSPK